MIVAVSRPPPPSLCKCIRASPCVSLVLPRRPPQVPVVTLQSLLDRAGRSHIDFLSIDVEGGEIAVLQGIDFTRTTVGLLTVEAAYADQKRDLAAFLKPRGFHFVGQAAQDMLWTRDLVVGGGRRAARSGGGSNG